VALEDACVKKDSGLTGPCQFVLNVLILIAKLAFLIIRNVKLVMMGFIWI
jgi:hypothetical protein